jgi:excisionase family DNA binding protein
MNQEVPMGNEEWVDLYAAAEDLGVTRQTLYRLLDQFEVPRFRRAGQRRVMIRRADVERMKEPLPIDVPRRGRPRIGQQGKAIAAA